MLRVLGRFRWMSTAKATWEHPNPNPGYYDLLGVKETATPAQIKQAYHNLVQLYHPGLGKKGDPTKFQKINEAYVILSNESTKRAYDLLKVGNRHFRHVNRPAEKEPEEMGDLATHKQKIREMHQKKLNVDDFGRYKGGLPRPKSGFRRGGALGEPGEFHDRMVTQESTDTEYQDVDFEKAESFKNFHQNERYDRTLKWTWFKAEVDYNFFSPRRLLPFLKFAFNASIFLIVFPLFAYYFLQFKNKEFSNGNSNLKIELKKHQEKEKQPVHKEH